jgi:hypothetical protein
MSFLDNLENTLKNMERGSELEEQEDVRKVASERASAPYAHALRRSDWTQRLLTECVTIGHGQRTRINMAWIEDVLRLDARERRMELCPTPQGIQVIMQRDGVETHREMADLSGDPAALVARWLTS